jgi:hypothetical protein
VAFTSDYFVKDDETVSCSDHQYFPGMTETYSVEQAEAHIEYLKDTLARARSQPRGHTRYWVEQLEEEISHFETELRIHRSVQNSQNVTLRERQQPRWAPVYPEDNTNGGRREIACSNMW